MAQIAVLSCIPHPTRRQRRRRWCARPSRWMKYESETGSSGGRRRWNVGTSKRPDWWTRARAGSKSVVVCKSWKWLKIYWNIWLAWALLPPGAVLNQIDFKAPPTAAARETKEAASWTWGAAEDWLRGSAGTPKGAGASEDWRANEPAPQDI